MIFFINIIITTFITKVSQKNLHFEQKQYEKSLDIDINKF
jgi:hypothetical protein